MLSELVSILTIFEFNRFFYRWLQNLPILFFYTFAIPFENSNIMKLYSTKKYLKYNRLFSLKTFVMFNFFKLYNELLYWSLKKLNNFSSKKNTYIIQFFFHNRILKRSLHIPVLQYVCFYFIKAKINNDMQKIPKKKLYPIWKSINYQFYGKALIRNINNTFTCDLGRFFDLCPRVIIPPVWTCECMCLSF